MSQDAITETLRQFIARELLEGDDAGLDAETPLIELGVISSMSIVLLSAFITDEYGVTVPQREMTVANLSKLSRMAALVQRLVAERG